MNELFKSAIEKVVVENKAKNTAFALHRDVSRRREVLQRKMEIVELAVLFYNAISVPYRASFGTSCLRAHRCQRSRFGTLWSLTQ